MTTQECGSVRGTNDGPSMPPRPPFIHWTRSANAMTQLFLSVSARQEVVNLCGGLPAPEVYPTGEFPALLERVMHNWGARALSYAPIEGVPELRAMIAQRYSTPALHLEAENVLITSGSMQGLDLLGKVLIEPGNTVLAHYPTYLGALDAWRPREPRYSELHLDRISIEQCESMPASEAQFIYTVPNFSNPTGHLVSREMRAALLKCAVNTGTWLVEDDPYGALFYDDDPLPSILDLSAEAGFGPPDAGPVVYLGTTSKTFVPGIRIGWAIGAPEMINALTLAKQSTDLCTSALCQFIALEAFDSGLVDRLVPQIVELYRLRRDVICEALSRHLEPYFDWEVPRGGMFVWLSAKDEHMDTDVLFHAALKAGVAFTPSSVFDSKEGHKRAMRVNFTLNPPDVLREGVERLGRVTKQVLERS